MSSSLICLINDTTETCQNVEANREPWAKIRNLILFCVCAIYTNIRIPYHWKHKCVKWEGNCPKSPMYIKIWRFYVISFRVSLVVKYQEMNNLIWCVQSSVRVAAQYLTKYWLFQGLLSFYIFFGCCCLLRFYVWNFRCCCIWIIYNMIYFLVVDCFFLFHSES